MWTVQQKAEFVLLYTELKSVVTVQRKWRLHPGEKVPDDTALNRWLKQFKETGSVAKQKSSGRSGTYEENVYHIRQSCVRSPKRSLARRLELGIPKTMIQNVIHKRLCLYAYKIRLKHEMKPHDRPKHYFASLMLNKIDDTSRQISQTRRLFI
jgi:hypothetical protein